METADLDRLIGEVAKRHHFLLDRSDPVLITVTLNELVLARVIAQIEAGAQTAKTNMAAGAAQQMEAAKTAASRLVTAAAEYADEQFRLAAKNAAEDMKSGLLQELSRNPIVVDADKVTRAASFVRWAAAFVYLAATVTALIAVIFPLAFLSPPSAAGCKPPTPNRALSADR